MHLDDNSSKQLFDKHYEYSRELGFLLRKTSSSCFMFDNYIILFATTLKLYFFISYLTFGKTVILISFLRVSIVLSVKEYEKDKEYINLF